VEVSNFIGGRFKIFGEFSIFYPDAVCRYDRRQFFELYFYVCVVLGVKHNSGYA
jgi:hypothetical protein